MADLSYRLDAAWNVVVNDDGSVPLISGQRGPTFGYIHAPSLGLRAFQCAVHRAARGTHRLVLKSRAQALPTKHVLASQNLSLRVFDGVHADRTRFFLCLGLSATCWGGVR